MPLLADITGNLNNTMDTVSKVTGAEKVSQLADRALSYMATHATQFIAGTIILLVGLMITGGVARTLARALERRKLEPPERLLIVMVVRLLMFGLTIVVVADACGYETKAVLAGLGFLAVGIGFAMQGLLGNIIAGLTLVFTKPFRVGEYIEIFGAQGLVVHVDVVSTTLLQLDHSKVVIPNHKIVGEVLHNLGTVRQLSLSVGVGYDTDLKRARELAVQVLGRNPRIVPKPAPLVTVGALRDSAIAISIKSWVKLADYEVAEGELNEAIIECYRQNQIEIPYPRRDVRILNPATAAQITSHEQTQKSK